jgi:glyoxylase-like metal-dependent hydrolase (beta-lactamase superfamily II)
LTSKKQKEFSMQIKVLPLGPIEANCVILWEDPAKAWIIDPGAEADKVKEFLSENLLTPALVIATHGHFDHIGAIPELLKSYEGLKFHIGPGDEAMIGHPDNAWAPYYPRIEKPSGILADLTDGAILEEGGLCAKVIATPGHTPGGVCLYFDKQALLITGDTLFAGSCGRTDFPGGSMPTLMASLAKLSVLPPETAVISGHGPETTIGQELVVNPYLQDAM